MHAGGRARRSGVAAGGPGAAPAPSPPQVGEVKALASLPGEALHVLAAPLGLPQHAGQLLLDHALCRGAHGHLLLQPRAHPRMAVRGAGACMRSAQRRPADGSARSKAGRPGSQRCARAGPAAAACCARRPTCGAGGAAPGAGGWRASWPPACAPPPGAAPPAAGCPARRAAGSGLACGRRPARGRRHVCSGAVQGLVEQSREAGQAAWRRLLRGQHEPRGLSRSPAAMPTHPPPLGPPPPLTWITPGYSGGTSTPNSSPQAGVSNRLHATDLRRRRDRRGSKPHRCAGSLKAAQVTVPGQAAPLPEAGAGAGGERAGVAAAGGHLATSWRSKNSTSSSCGGRRGRGQAGAGG